MRGRLLGLLFAATYAGDVLLAPLVGIGAACAGAIFLQWIGIFSAAQVMLLPLALGCLVTAALLRRDQTTGA